MVNRTLLALFVLLPMAGGCQGALWGNALMLAISVGIFVGTLSLGSAKRDVSDASHAKASVPKLGAQARCRAKKP